MVHQGVDLSEEMLALAEMHAREANLAIPFMQGNMLDLSALGQYSAVTELFQRSLQLQL